jgi:hypothetical protein
MRIMAASLGFRRVNHAAFRPQRNNNPGDIQFGQFAVAASLRP